jgi:hypothetical protein
MNNLRLIVKNDLSTYRLRLTGERYGREIRREKDINKQILNENLNQLIHIEKMMTLNYELTNKIKNYNRKYNTNIIIDDV